MTILSPLGEVTYPAERQRGRSQSPAVPDLSIPKNRSTGNLLANAPRGAEKGRIRFSDAGLTAAEYDTMSRSVLSAVLLLAPGLVGIVLGEAQPSNVSDLCKGCCIYITDSNHFLYQISGHDRARTWPGCIRPPAHSTAAAPTSAYFSLLWIFFS